MIEHPKTYVFMDESGDSGFKIGKGSTLRFTIAATIFYDTCDMDHTESVIRELRTSLGLKRTHEFHFNKETRATRAAFCQAVCRCPFLIRALTVDKTLIYDDSMLRRSPEHFYSFITKMLLQHNFGTIANAHVKIDGKMNRELKTYLHRELNREEKIIRKTDFVASHTSDLIQLADMVVGSIARSYKMDTKDGKLLRGILKPCIDDIWEFGAQKQEGPTP